KCGAVGSAPLYGASQFTRSDSRASDGRGVFNRPRRTTCGKHRPANSAWVMDDKPDGPGVAACVSAPPPKHPPELAHARTSAAKTRGGVCSLDTREISGASSMARFA